MKILSNMIMAVILTSSFAFAEEAIFPKDFKSWKSVTTPLTKIGALPGCDADVSKLPAIYQETVAKYCAIKPGGPGKVAILVKPSVLDSYKTRSKTGKHEDGPSMILHLQDLKVLFLTSYKKNKPVYSVFTEGGKNITKKEGGLAAKTCVRCHTGYQAFCVNGQCGQLK